jgi:outer membrane protein TolC
MAHFRNTSCLFLALCLASFISKAQSPIIRNLDFFMEQGLNASPLLKDNKNQQRSNKIDSLRWRAAYGPQVTASSTGLYAPVLKGYGFDQALTNGQALEALLTVNYAIVGKGRIKSQLEQFRLQQDSLQFAGKWSELDLRKNITDQYLNSFASQQQMEFNKELYELLKKEELILKKLTRANTYKQSEYLTFLVIFQQQHLQWRQSEMQFKNDYATLNSLCGLSDTTVAYLKEPVFEQTYLADHTFFRQRFKLDSLRNENGKKAVDLDYKPKAIV